jgi:hypothetical protein
MVFRTPLMSVPVVCAEATVAVCTMRLRDGFDLDTVRDELLVAVVGAVQPTHASVWIRPPVDPLDAATEPRWKGSQTTRRPGYVALRSTPSE